MTVATAMPDDSDDDTQVVDGSHKVFGVVAGTDGSGDAQRCSVSRSGPGAPDLSAFHELRIWAESYEDCQRNRISIRNRTERGGVDPELFAPQLAALDIAEHQFELALHRSYRRLVRTYLPGVDVWQKTHNGIGEHLLARLLGTLAHPRIAAPYSWMNGDTPMEHECGPSCGEARHLVAQPMFERSLRQLYSYCGYGDPERKRRKGMNADDALALGNPRAKMLLHLLAEKCVMQKCRPEPSTWSEAMNATAGSAPPSAAPIGEPNARSEAVQPDPSTPPRKQPEASPVAAGSSSTGQPRNRANAKSVAADRYLYRATYEHARAKYADREDWSKGHQHNAALRVVAKRILRDLYEAAA